MTALAERKGNREPNSVGYHDWPEPPSIALSGPKIERKCPKVHTKYRIGEMPIETYDIA